MKKKNLSHVDSKGDARMVDIGGKSDSERRALAEARVSISSELLSAIKENNLAKGDVLSTARIAGIQAAKRTAELIPLCHTLPLDFVSVDFEIIDDPPSILIKTEARTVPVHDLQGQILQGLGLRKVRALHGPRAD